MMILLFLGSLNCFPSQMAIKDSESPDRLLMCCGPSLEKFTLSLANAEAVATILKKKFRSPRMSITSAGPNVILVWGTPFKLRKYVRKLTFLAQLHVTGMHQVSDKVRCLKVKC